MRKIILPVILLSINQAILAQSEPVTVPEKMFGENGTKTITKSMDQKNLDQVTVIEIRESRNGQVRLRITWRKGIDGKYKRLSESFSPGGKPGCTYTLEFDENMNLTGNVGLKKFVRNADGSMYVGDDDHWHPDIVKRYEEPYRKEIKSIEEDNPTVAEPKKTACSEVPGSSCQPKARFFVGYSYLNSFSNGQSESFPLGVMASAVINITPHITAGVNASYHTKKINNENLTRYFVLAIANYHFGKVTKCDRKLYPDVHILAGLAGEKYGPSKGSGFAYGAGAGLGLKITKGLAMGAQVDYVAVKFKNSNQTTNNAFASMGVIINLLRSGQMEGGGKFRF